MLSTILLQRPAKSIDDVVAIMTAIDQALPPADGLKWFNRLYLRVTEAVRTAAGTATAFHDEPFMHRLDVVFANLYFDAAAAGDVDPSTAPPAWQPLFQARTTMNLLPLQLALAGMNAHINRDLPAAIVATYGELGGAPSDADPRHDDFERINAILEAVETQIKPEFAAGVIKDLDEIAAPVDDIGAMWSVRAAREAAWTNAEVLWQLKPVPALQQSFFDRLDRLTGFAGRGMLVPVVPASAGSS